MSASGGDVWQPDAWANDTWSPDAWEAEAVAVTVVTGAYAAEHASGYADVLAAGARITFTKNGVSVSGVATPQKANIQQYAQMRLTQTDIVTLLFFADTYGEEPEVGATGDWGGKTYIVAAANPYAPDGVPLLSNPVIAR